MVRWVLVMWVVLLACGCVSRRTYQWTDAVPQDTDVGPVGADCAGRGDCTFQDGPTLDLVDNRNEEGRPPGDGLDGAHVDASDESTELPDGLDALDVTDSTACVPSCTGRECGFDGCSSTCGACGPERACTMAGRCEMWPTCSGQVCPKIDGYVTYCNYRGFCEYANELPLGWAKWDIWILVPPGTFDMGSQDAGGTNAELPVHTVTIHDMYMIGKYELTVVQYEACLESGLCMGEAKAEQWIGVGWGANSSAKGRGSHPQNALTRVQAEAACQWVAEGGRLLTEAEWEYAASGPIHRKYPWGDTPEPNCSNDTAIFDEDGSGTRPWGCNPCTEFGCSGTSPVTSKVSGGSWCGAMGMGGNVWEWVADSFHKNYLEAPDNGKAWVTGGTGDGVMRGGAFNDGATYRRCSFRGGANLSATNANIGVRCARPVPVCKPDCVDRDCGPDGCGSECGQCTGFTVCEQGQCVCESHHHMDCYTGELFWYDSCGVVEGLATTCPCGCEDAACLDC